MVTVLNGDSDQACPDNLIINSAVHTGRRTG